MQSSCDRTQFRTLRARGGVSVGNDHFSLQMRVFFVRPSNPSKMHAATREAAANRFGGWPGTQGSASTEEVHEATGPRRLEVIV